MLSSLIISLTIIGIAAAISFKDVIKEKLKKRK